jgi:hypothetical protein
MAYMRGFSFEMLYHIISCTLKLLDCRYYLKHLLVLVSSLLQEGSERNGKSSNWICVGLRTGHYLELDFALAIQV